MYKYKHPRPSAAVDLTIFKHKNNDYQILLIQRSLEPYQGYFALPGGFMEIDESLENAASRELAEETGLEGLNLGQIGTFSDPDRDPRGRVITTCFGIILDDQTHYPLQAGDDASSANWFPLNDLPQLAFDHQKIINLAKKRLNIQN